MTRANLNFVWQERGESPKTLCFYHNGDQYPQGLRDYFGVVDWLKDEKAFTPEGFKEWIRKTYFQFHEEHRKEFEKKGAPYPKYKKSDFEPRLISHPCIHYDEAGFPTDYSYVFEVGLICKYLPQTKEEKANNTRRMKWLNGVKVYHWDKLIFKGTVKQFITWIEKARSGIEA